jgi:hypothetical protein
MIQSLPARYNNLSVSTSFENGPEINFSDLDSNHNEAIPFYFVEKDHTTGNRRASPIPFPEEYIELSPIPAKKVAPIRDDNLFLLAVQLSTGAQEFQVRSPNLFLAKMSLKDRFGGMSLKFLRASRICEIN